MGLLPKWSGVRSGWVVLMLDRRDRGATMVEYSIMVVLVAAVVFGVVAALGITVNGLFDAAVTRWP